jgi:hypothetical protein
MQRTILPALHTVRQTGVQAVLPALCDETCQRNAYTDWLGLFPTLGGSPRSMLPALFDVCTSPRYTLSMPFDGCGPATAWAELTRPTRC